MNGLVQYNEGDWSIVWLWNECTKNWRLFANKWRFLFQILFSVVFYMLDANGVIVTLHHKKRMNISTKCHQIEIVRVCRAQHGFAFCWAYWHISLKIWRKKSHTNQRALANVRRENIKTTHTIILLGILFGLLRFTWSFFFVNCLSISYSYCTQNHLIIRLTLFI